MQTFSCYVIGGDSLLLECAELLLRDGHAIRGVISDNPRIAQWAQKGGIPHLPVAGYEAALSGQDFDYLFAITHLAIVPDAVLALPGLALDGLMTIGPAIDDPEAARPGFRELRSLRDDVAARLGVELPHLSMGMSGDFAVAVEEGATLVRLGRVLFGARRSGAWREG